MRFPDSFREIRQPGRRYPPLKWPSKNTKSMKIWRYFIIFSPDSIFSLIECIFWLHDCYSITTWSKNFISEVSSDFLCNFEISALQISQNLKFSNSAWSLQRGVPPPGRWISRKEPGNRIFRSRRCGLKKSDQKILFFVKLQPSGKCFFLVTKSEFGLHSLAGGFI